MGSLTWEEAFEYVQRKAAEDGEQLRITNPELLAQTIQLIRAGKANLDAARIEMRPTPTRRKRNDLK